MYTLIPWCKGNQERVDPSDNVNIELVKCGAYEAVKLSRQAVTMRDNPAYGEIGIGSTRTEWY